MGALVVACHHDEDGRREAFGWVAERLRDALRTWQPPAWGADEAMVRRALDEGMCLTEPLAGLGPLSPEQSSALASRLGGAALLGSRLRQRSSVVLWLAFADAPDRERVAGLEQLFTRLGATLHRRYRDYFEHLPVVFLAATMEGTILECSDRIRELGYEPEDLIGKPTAFLFAPGERERLRAKLVQSGEVPRHEVVFRHRSGESIAVDLTASVLCDEHGQPREVLTIGRDLRPVWQLDHYRRLEAVGRMVTGVAHELNNPLMTVLGNAEMLAEMKLPGAAHRRAERVLAGARRCQEVVDGMLRVRLKHREPEEGVDLEGVVDRAVHAVRAEFAQQNVTVDIRPLPGLPTIRGVAADLEQAMANLLRNAFQAVAACSDPHVEISLDAEAEGLRIVVQDNGQGMPPDVLERAFEPFFTTREVGAGRGLGLPIALGIVQEHGGVIELRSSANGTQAVVRLPVAGVRPVTEEDDS